jgi:hypothetical protein
MNSDKVRITDLREKDAFYEYWWSKGRMHPRRTALVDKKEYNIFKKQQKNSNTKISFLLSG